MSEKIEQGIEQQEERYAMGTEVIGLPGTQLSRVRGRIIGSMEKPGHIAYGQYQLEIIDEGARKIFGEEVWVKPEEIGRADRIKLDQLRNLTPGTHIKTSKGEKGAISEKKHERYPDDYIIVEMEDGSVWNAALKQRLRC